SWRGTSPPRSHCNVVVTSSRGLRSLPRGDPAWCHSPLRGRPLNCYSEAGQMRTLTTESERLLDRPLPPRHCPSPDQVKATAEGPGQIRREGKRRKMHRRQSRSSSERPHSVKIPTGKAA